MGNEMDGKVWNGRKGVWEDKANGKPGWEAVTTEQLIANYGKPGWEGVQAELKRREARGEIVPSFDPRTEISADARHISGRIVKHLWIIFVLLPVVLGILFAILTAK